MVRRGLTEKVTFELRLRRDCVLLLNCISWACCRPAHSEPLGMGSGTMYFNIYTHLNLEIPVPHLVFFHAEDFDLTGEEIFAPI